MSVRVPDASKLRSTHLLLEQREVERRRKTSKQAERIERGHPYTAKAAQLPANRLKNRLLLPKPIHGNDYINASWIREPDFQLPHPPRHDHPSPHPQQQTWIAAQGPLPETCYEFFSLCLNPDPARRPRVIIQLTAWQEGGREKCACYLPAKVGGVLEFRAQGPLHVGQSTRHGGGGGDHKFRWSPAESRVRVTLESSHAGPVHSSSGRRPATSSFYRQNTLLLQHVSCGDAGPSGEVLSDATLTHYECIDWPDRGTPLSTEPILHLIRSAKTAARTIQPDAPPSPILVHCSAGVGRTGTLIAIASCEAHLHRLSHTTDNSPPQNTNLQLPQQLPGLGRLQALPSALDEDLVAHTVDFLREQRVCMVQTEAQLGFVYKALAESAPSPSEAVHV
ncbi:hypothetical protein PCANC_07657 [Puccinia coronata f. sp. avenae]|uniref:Tyrosine specific protein phosphatases domain-containing protein n=1 Tax=Puccinia coronata f. sp. avenae TaxID=200324 RepID=A0A2N5T2L8_9BASI|nr:hypothetical protein PCASD_25315 [Puccinia coronata f. sp. avenae]PLW19731.1 hypothetical protein PCANC_07657 [Puccinia coronata f. sp. avenae]PLW40999.1 hypothetical protein PCASD_06590 [Puccinia coronata f. sp. avenae]